MDNIATDALSKEKMMFFAGAEPWHKLGQYVGQNCVTWAEAMKQAHLDWTVSKRQLFGKIGESFKLISAWGIFRDDINDFIATVGDVYRPIQNHECFDFVDALLGVSAGSHYETAGALGNGYQVWCLARIPEADFEINGGDQHRSYLLFTTSHDGSLAAQAKITTTRVVCQNTLFAALASEGQMLKIKHTTNADEKLSRARAMMGKAVNGAKELAGKLATLAERKLTRESVATIFDRLFPKPKDETQNQTRRVNAIGDILSLFERNDDNAYPEIRGSAYNLLNAFTEYTDHQKTARVTDKRPGYTQEQARIESSMFGSGAQFKGQVLDVILEATNGAPILQKRTLYSAPNGNGLTTGSQLLDAICDQTPLKPV
jgi:phage/plasmid-like protein (TIGR03299 family)